MSVYIDKSRNRYGRMIMCHMIADTPLELWDMARAIGVKLKWFQSRASTPHFDICLAKRELAIHHGAIELERKEFVAVMKRARAIWPWNKNCWEAP